MPKLLKPSPNEMPADAKPLSRLLYIGARFANFQKNGQGYKALCPAHDDTKPSLSINEGEDGRVLLCCLAGCETDRVLSAKGLSFADLFPTNPMIVATYDYRDENGAMLYQAVRYDPKNFKQRAPDANGGWCWTTKDVRKVLYRLPELLKADPTQTVFVVEGEKDADRLAGLGLVATTNVGGAGKWKPEYNEALRGRYVVILRDNDEAGRSHMEKAASNLHGMATSIKVLLLPGLPEKGDVSNWLDAGGTLEKLLALAKMAPEWTKENAAESACRNSQAGGNPGTYRKNQEGGMPPDLAGLKATFKRHYYFSDDDVIDVVLGIVAGNGFDSDPIWLYLISAPSGGKTELLLSLFDCAEAYFLSDFTPAALISGFRDDESDNEAGAKDYSLLPQLNGKVVVTKDFSLIHSKPSETRAQILSILRDVYDGYSSRALGNSEPKGFHSKFNYLAGMTPDIEKSWSLNTLGERFLLYRIKIENRRDHAKRALKNVLDKDGGSTGVRKTLQTQVKAFIDGLPTPRLAPKVDDAMLEKIIDLADVLSTCRTYVHRERNDDMTCLPQAELATRVSKQLMRVGQSVALVRGKATVTDAEFAIMKRIALDSLPTNRRQLLTSLWNHRANGKPLETFAKEVSRIAKTTIRRELENLAELGAVERTMTQITLLQSKTNKLVYNPHERNRQGRRYAREAGNARARRRQARLRPRQRVQGQGGQERPAQGQRKRPAPRDEGQQATQGLRVYRASG